MSTALELIQVQPNLARDIKRQEIIKTIQDRITTLNLPLQSYKNNAEFSLLVLNLIEYLVVKSYKIDKKALAIQILTTMLNLNASEAQALDINIEFLHANKMIKKVSRFKLFCTGIGELFFSKKK